MSEIVVTAQRREQRLQDTPVSVTALTGDTLRELGVQDLIRAGDFAPNVRITAGPQGSGASFVAAPFIRGIGQQDYLITTDPGVAVYVDDVYYARTVGEAFRMLDVDRVEILRGPQGTLFGKNAIGGAINVISSQPDEATHGTAELSYGRFNEHSLRADLNLPLADTVSSRVAVVTHKSDGFADRLDPATGAVTAKQGADDDAAIRARVRWKPTNSLTGTFAVDYQRVREPSVDNQVVAINPQAPLAAFYNALIGTPSGRPYTAAYLNSDPYNNYATGPNVAKLDQGGIAATLEDDLGFAKLKSITAYRRMKAIFGSDGDGSPLPFLQQLIDDHQHQFSQELQLSGHQSVLTWLGGLYYFNEYAEEDSQVQVLSGLFPALESLPLPLIPLGPYTCPNSNATTPCAGGPGNALNATFDNNFNGNQNQKTNSYSVFGQLTAALAQHWSLTLGARWTRDEKVHHTYYEKAQSGVVLVPPGYRQQQAWSAFTPKFGIEYQPQADLLAYLSAARGFRSGGFNGRPTTGPAGAAPFNPEYLWSYEGGLKSEWLEHRLRVNTALFYNKYTNMQVTVARIVDGAILNGLQNAGGATIKGAEVELTARPLQPLHLSLSLSHLNAYYTSLAPDVSGFDIHSKLQQAPRFSGSVVVRYDFAATSRATGYVDADFSYRSEIYNDAANTPNLRQGGYGLLGARLGVETPDRHWEAALYGTNLTDKVVTVGGVGALNALGFDEVVRGRPREFGVTFTYRFGTQ